MERGIIGSHRNCGETPRSYRTCDLFAGSRDHLKMAQQLFQLVGAGGPEFAFATELTGGGGYDLKRVEDEIQLDNHNKILLEI